MAQAKRHTRKRLKFKWFGIAALCALASAAMAAPITLPMQKRDKSNKPSVEQVKVEAREIGIIVMDKWDSHWDRTYQERSGAIVKGSVPECAYSWLHFCIMVFIDLLQSPFQSLQFRPPFPLQPANGLRHS